MSLQEVEKSFIYSVPTIENGNEIEVYINFLEKVNEKFHLLTSPSFKVSYAYGMSIYYTEEEDLKTELSIGEKNYATQFHHYIKPANQNFLAEGFKNLKVISSIFNRYFIEQDDSRRIIVTDMSGASSNEKKLNISLSTNPNAAVLGEQINFYSNHPIQQKIAKMEEQLDSYKECKLFDLLSENTRNIGTQLAKNYSLSHGSVLWCFKNLIVPSCPRESGGYEQELKSFLNITQGQITYSDYSEVKADFGNNLITVKCLLNGEPFEVTGLKEQFSFKFIVELNRYLSMKYNTSFYVWAWENNPWEQQTFIYLNNDTFKEFVQPNKRREFNELGGYIVEFYDENR